MTSAAGPAAAPRRGRRTGKADTRSDILAAARAEFAAKGYDGASVRGIARAAGVDPALVHHYFGGKEKVFLAAMHLRLQPDVDLPALLEPGIDGLGERLARYFLSAWADPQTREPFLALVRSATTSEQGAALLRQFVSRALLRRVAGALELADRELRVSVGAAQLVGIAMLRYVVRVEPLASADEDAIVALVAPTLQRYLDPDLEPRVGQRT